VKQFVLAIVVSLAATALIAGEAPAAAPPPAPAPAAEEQTDTTAADARELSEGLVYSVNRTPERPFETARAVEVITREEIWRKNATSLSEILHEEPGFVKYRTLQNSATPLVRGLVGRQVLVMIDGVKINNALSGDTPNMDLIDISQIERIELVRGVVSVLGTESLGGVINIITRKGERAEHAAGGSVGLQYSTATESFSTPVQAHGQNEHFRWIAGGNYQTFGEARGGGDVGTQRFSDFTQRAAHIGLDYFVSPEKTLSFAYRASEQVDVKTAPTLISGVSLRAGSSPADFHLGTISYQDLTDRGWSESLRVTGYWNQQNFGTFDVRAATPQLETSVVDEDRLLGLNLELGSFIGRHHLVYGVDVTHDSIESFTRDERPTGTTFRRGRFTDGATYQTAGIYAQDRVAVSKWLTATAGLRYGVFRTSGSETLPVVGAIDLDSSKSDITGAVNLVLHASPNLNIIGNVMRGFRAPNLRDISSFGQTATTVTLPNPGVAAERMLSYEGGVKYENEIFSATAFYFRNTLSNLLIVSASTFNGLDFIDANRNGVKDAGEPAVRSNKNLGKAIIDGYELDLRYAPRPWLSFFGNYAVSDGEATTAQQATLVQRVPPPVGAAGIRFNARNARYAPWAEFIWAFNKPYEFNGVELSPATKELRLRAGVSPAGWFRVAVSGENLTDTEYIPRFAAFAYPGRRLVVTTEFRF
jgi:outer membrane receptor protein involved in Fe transport